MKLLNKLKITLLTAFFIIILFNLKSFAVTGVITEITVNLREEPSTDSKRIMYVTQDYKVEVLEKVGEWYKIKYNGVTGYVFGEYLEVDGSKLVTTQPEVEQEAENTEIQEIVNEKEETTEQPKEEQQETIQDVTTDAELKLQIKKSTDLRLIPNITSNAIYTFKKAISVNVIEQMNEWSYVSVDNILGWVRTDNIVEENAETTKEDTTEKDSETSSEKENSSNEAKIAYIKYDTVNLRKKASTSSTVLAKLKLNDKVTVLEKVNSTWSKVEVDDIVGYVSTDLLADEKQEEIKQEESSTTSRDGETVSREEETNSEQEEAKTDSVVKVETTSNSSETKNENKETSSNSETTKEDVISSKNETSEKENTTATSSKTKGEEIAEYAKKYVGYKYVYGGSSPKTGFDCSGLTYYVYKQFGYTISRSSTAQAKNGKEVSKEDLQPGDLIIYKNTSLTSIGHVGIYIGDNKMVHASEPGVGVIITDIDSKAHNYHKRYVTARRIV